MRARQLPRKHGCCLFYDVLTRWLERNELDMGRIVTVISQHRDYGNNHGRIVTVISQHRDYRHNHGRIVTVISQHQDYGHNHSRIVTLIYGRPVSR
jgi:hypothetical protein